MLKYLHHSFSSSIFVGFLCLGLVHSVEWQPIEDITMTSQKLCKQPLGVGSTNPAGVFLQDCQHTNAGAPGDGLTKFRLLLCSNMAA